MSEKIVSCFIIEILGRPAKHIEKSLSELIDRLGGEKGIIVTGKKIHKAKKVKEAKNVFTTFAEVETEIESLDLLFDVIFRYMPSHIEIIQPQELKLKLSDLNFVANELTKRLHQYDEIAKVLGMEKDILKKKLEAKEKS